MTNERKEVVINSLDDIIKWRLPRPVFNGKIIFTGKDTNYLWKFIVKRFKKSAHAGYQGRILVEARPPPPIGSNFDNYAVKFHEGIGKLLCQDMQLKLLSLDPFFHTYLGKESLSGKEFGRTLEATEKGVYSYPGFYKLDTLFLGMDYFSKRILNLNDMWLKTEITLKPTHSKRMTAPFVHDLAKYLNTNSFTITNISNEEYRA